MNSVSVLPPETFALNAIPKRPIPPWLGTNPVATQLGFLVSTFQSEPSP